MNTYKKGWRNEHRAVKELEALGFRCCRAKISRHGANDFFGLFDVCAVKNGCDTLWIQVKSNSVSKKVRDAIELFENNFFSRTENIAVIAVWVDRKGWRFVLPSYGSTLECEFKKAWFCEAIEND